MVINKEHKIIEISEVVPLMYQVGGYSFLKKQIGLMSLEGGYVLKPIFKTTRGKHEERLYELLQNPCKALKPLARFVPKYYGTANFTLKNKPFKWLILEDVCHRFEIPCVMDIKIGRQTWDPDASLGKRLTEKLTYAKSKRDLGISLPGFQVYDTNKGRLLRYGSIHGNSLDGSGVKDALRLFVQGPVEKKRILVLKLLKKLWQILGWFQNQMSLNFYGSSILLTYDAYKFHNCDSNRYQFENSIITRRHGCIAKGPAHCFESQSLCDSDIFSVYYSNYDWHKLFNELKESSLKSVCDENFHEFHSFLKEGDSENEWVSVKMIDLAHVFTTTGNEKDGNYLYGLKNLIRILELFFHETLH